MKCPKCGYLGFETSDKCRNCGYDFSLSLHVDPPAELPLHQSAGAGAPLADFDLATHEASRSSATPDLDLDRVIGAQQSIVHAAPPVAVTAGAAAAPVAAPAAESLHARARVRAVPTAEPSLALPLFAPDGREHVDDTPLITAPRPVRPPLSVRRSTPDVPRGRSGRAPRAHGAPGPTAPELDLAPPGDPSFESAPGASDTAMPAAVESASAVARVAALLIDVVLLAAINGAVLYFTLAIAGLTLEDVRRIPPIPFGAFLLLLNGGYLVVFTAASGQTIGKMVTGIKVITDDNRALDLTGAVLRAGGCALSVLTVGLGYLPVLLSADGRALQDRVAGTRVVSVR